MRYFLVPCCAERSLQYRHYGNGENAPTPAHLGPGATHVCVCVCVHITETKGASEDKT